MSALFDSPTIKLYDADSHACRFSAKVLACEPVIPPQPLPEVTHKILLDSTLFFPEAGGQSADTGCLGGVRVMDVRDESGLLWHLTDGALTVGEVVAGQIDWAPRFRKMQIHSGEHILSGLVHRDYGFSNVGFHLGESEVTVDFDGVLERDAWDRLETEANRLIWENHPVRAWYPDDKELSSLFYRSKGSLEGPIRVVQIGPDGCVDSCACCAPHVTSTGEIGLLKILDVIHYKGGVRLWLSCGIDALNDYRARYTQEASIGAALSVKQNQLQLAVDRFQSKIADLQQELSKMRREQIEAQLKNLTATDRNITLFPEGATAAQLREIVNRALPLCGGICTALSEKEGDTRAYQYIMASRTVDLRALAPTLNRDLNGRGGGTPGMIQGSFAADRETILAYLTNLSI